MYSDDQGWLDESGEADDARLEATLRNSMRRVQAPAGLADSIGAKIVRAASADRSNVGRPPMSLLPHVWRSWRLLFSRRLSMTLTAALLVLLFALFAGGEGYLQKRRQEQRQGQAAALQFALAMRLTRAALLDAGGHLAARGSAEKLSPTE